MCTLCAGFVWTTVRARLSLLDKNIGTSARFYAYITEKSHTKMLCWHGVRTYFTPLIWLRHRIILQRLFIIKNLFLRSNLLCRRFQHRSLQVKLKLFRAFCICFMVLLCGTILPPLLLHNLNHATINALNISLVTWNLAVLQVCCLISVYLLLTHYCIIIKLVFICLCVLVITCWYSVWATVC